MLNKEFENFDCKRFESEVFANNEPDPLRLRMQGIRNWKDVREHYGLSALRCDEWQLRQGFMSAPLHDALERTLGKERLASYFPTPAKPKLNAEEQDVQDLVTMMFGSLNEVSGLRNGGD